MKFWMAVLTTAISVSTSSVSVATVIAVPGDQATIQAGIDAVVEFCEGCRE